MKKLKRDYNSTMVSMTDKTGRSGNVDYRDCRVPSDKDLVEVANRYGFTTDIKVTITTVVGTKTKFLADVQNGRLIRKSAVSVRNSEIDKAKIDIHEREEKRLFGYLDLDLDVNLCMRKYKIKREEIESIVAERKQTVWRTFGSEYEEAMFNCALVEYVSDKVGNGII